VDRAGGELRRLAAGTLLVSFPGTAVPGWLARGLDGGIAGVCLFAGNVVRGAAHVTTALRSCRSDLLAAVDEEGGDVTRLEATTGSSVPGAAALGAVDDVDLTRALAGALGAELAAAGVDIDLAPVADVNTDAANPVIGVRSFGADADLVARHTAAFVDGLQAAGVAACAKHFPGHGATRVDSHLGLPVIDAPADVLRERELVPFRAAIAAGTALVMAGHLVVTALDDRPATVSRRVQVDLLRDDLGFEGAIVTDALDMAGAGGVAAIPTTAVRAVTAGADLCCLGPQAGADVIDATIDALATAVVDGSLPEARLREAADRVDAIRSRRAERGAPVEGELARLGAAAAASAVRVDGDLVPRRGAHVVELEASPTIAAGEVPWGIGEPLAALDPATTCERLGGGPVDGALSRAAGRPLVVVVRDPHRHPEQLRRARALIAARPDAIVVDLGWPSPDPVGGEVRVVAHGASRASRLAVARLLAGAVR
jgi:beta-N-acetylhexosaminidase